MPKREITSEIISEVSVTKEIEREFNIAGLDLISVEVAFKGKFSVDLLISNSKKRWISSGIEPLKGSTDDGEVLFFQYPNACANAIKLVAKGKGTLSAILHGEGAA
jgi:hypothetical protein